MKRGGSPESGGRAPGRPPSETLGPAILEAALQELGHAGYAGFSIEGVARRAGTAKTSIYRRWANKEALLAEAVRADLSRLESAAEEDTGSLRGDLRLHVRRVAAFLTPARVNAIAGLAFGSRVSSELASLMSNLTVQSEARTFRRLVGRAIERGELDRAPTGELALRVLPALMLQQLLFLSRPVSDRFATALVDEILLPILNRAQAKKTPAPKQRG
ncbi:MAG: TetR/AcrR family transcriptional regulator [Myxococcaceae bacterium]